MNGTPADHSHSHTESTGHLPVRLLLMMYRRSVCRLCHHPDTHTHTHTKLTKHPEIQTQTDTSTHTHTHTNPHTHTHTHRRLSHLLTEEFLRSDSVSRIRRVAGNVGKVRLVRAE